MAIVVNYIVSGSIASYTDLVAAVLDELDDANYPTASIDRAIRMAESHFNRELRTPEMEAKLDIAVTGELTTLPDDFLSMRSVYEAATPSFPLKTMSPSGLIHTYGRAAGTPRAYAIEGRQIRVAPIGAATISLDYYTKIPLLTVDSPSNWLLVNHPDLYRWGTLWYCFQRNRDTAGAATALQAVTSIIDSISVAGNRNRWGSGPLNPRGMKQVRGAVA